MCSVRSTATTMCRPSKPLWFQEVQHTLITKNSKLLAHSAAPRTTSSREQSRLGEHSIVNPYFPFSPRSNSRHSCFRAGRTPVIIDASTLEQSIDVTAISTHACHNYPLRMKPPCNYLSGILSWKALLHALGCMRHLVHRFHTDM